MFEEVSRQNQIWLADFSNLTRRFIFNERRKKHYNPNYVAQPLGYFKRKEDKPHLAKWSKFVMHPNSYNPERKIHSIPFYKKPLAVFAIMDSYSRLILHAHLTEIGEFKGGFIHKFFPLQTCCFQESLAVSKRLLENRYSNPSLFVTDWLILRSNNRFLKEINFAREYFQAKHPIFLSPLERRSKILNGLTPIEKYLNLIPPVQELEKWRESERKRRSQYQLNRYYQNREKLLSYQKERYREHRKELIEYQMKRYRALKKENV